MSTTNTTVKPEDKWKEVATSGSGIFSGSSPFQFCYSTDVPADGFYGHRVNNGNTEAYTLPAGEKLYAKGNMIFVLTPD